ncbi:MAG: hypothetical protein WAU81_01535 [Candidatus Aminicenantales bacterium]
MVLLIVAMAGFAAAQAQKPAGYHLLKKHVLGGEGGWDYMALDGGSRLLYVTHGSAVEILNVDTGVKGEPITGLPGVHGVTFAHDRDRGYISNGRGNSVSVFDLKTHKVLVEIPTSGQNPDAIMYDALSDRVFAFNGRTANVTAIDLKNKRPFSVCDNVMVVSDFENGKVVTAEFGPAPPPTKEQPRPRPSIVPGSFMVLEFGR